MTLHERTQALEKQYIQILKEWEQETDLSSISLKIPKYVAPFQFHLRSLFVEYSNLQDQLDQIFHDSVIEYKMQMSELSNFTFNASELKRMIETSKEHREIKKQQDEISNDMKLIEDIIKTMQNQSFNISNAIKWQAFISGENI